MYSDRKINWLENPFNNLNYLSQDCNWGREQKSKRKMKKNKLSGNQWWINLKKTSQWQTLPRAVRRHNIPQSWLQSITVWSTRRENMMRLAQQLRGQQKSSQPCSKSQKCRASDKRWEQSQIGGSSQWRTGTNTQHPVHPRCFWEDTSLLGWTKKKFWHKKIKETRRVFHSCMNWNIVAEPGNHWFYSVTWAWIEYKHAAPQILLYTVSERAIDILSHESDSVIWNLLPSVFIHTVLIHCPSLSAANPRWGPAFSAAGWVTLIPQHQPCIIHPRHTER